MLELILILLGSAAILIVFLAAASVIIGYATQAAYRNDCFCGLDGCDKCDS